MNQAEEHYKILPCPQKPSHLPNDIHWLSGEGCGSWFCIENVKSAFTISRYSPEGKLECKGIFEQVDGNHIKINESFEFTYLSHCAEVNIIQNNQNLKFKLVSKC
ncbi:MAG: hypothetical protein IPI93_14390 [Sphingobacteriaceae bacterium]|nr:hypothetical protein [Sphingobacteriaceae bacterium]